MPGGFHQRLISTCLRTPRLCLPISTYARCWKETCWESSALQLRALMGTRPLERGQGKYICFHSFPSRTQFQGKRSIFVSVVAHVAGRNTAVRKRRTGRWGSMKQQVLDHESDARFDSTSSYELIEGSWETRL